MKAVLLALFLAAAVLIGVEFAQGAAHAGRVHLADPCQPRNLKTDALQRVVLDGLDGAACKLHLSREALVLSIGASSPFHTHWTNRQIEVAVRAGLLRAVDEAERRGDIPSLLAGPIRQAIKTLPIDKLISLGDFLSP